MFLPPFLLTSFSDMPDVESSQVSVTAETVIPDMESSHQTTSDSELILHWQPVHIAGAKGATRYWIVEPTKVCFNFCTMQMKVYRTLIQSH